MWRILSLLILSVFCALQLFSQENNYPINWEVIETQNFKVYHPKSWIKSLDGQVGTSLILVCPDVLDYNPFRENVSLYKQSLSSFPVEVNLSSYAELTKGELYSLYPDIAFLRTEKKLHNGREYYELNYTFSRENFQLKSLQYIWIIGNYAFSLTYMGDQKDYDKFFPAALQIMQSFEFKEQ